jgi:Alpha-glucosidases, family 31 of glycosyl hydrolases
MINRCIGSVIGIFLFAHATAQQITINTVGKDPFNGKALETVYKAKDGAWYFQSYNNTIIKTTYRPADYTKYEQVTDAVMSKPPAVTTKITNAASQTVEYENQTSVVIQRERLYYKAGREVRVKAATYFAEGDYRGFRFQLSANEQLFGGGERATAMNRRGQRLNLYNTGAYGYGLGESNLSFSVPFIISSSGYGIFFDNPSKGYLDIGLTDKNTLEAGFSSGELVYYVILGRSIDEILRNYASITGRQPLPPRWAMGNFVSRFGYRSEEQVKSIVSKMRQENFPMDGLVFDLFWFGDDTKGTLGNLDWVNAQKWPNPKQMLTDLKTKENLKSILVTQPYILQNTKTYAEATPFLATDAGGKPMMVPEFFFGTGGLVDIFRKPAQDWIWKYYKKQVSNGVSGWWVSQAEPGKHPSNMMHNLKDYGITRPMAADEVHNIYGHYWNKMFFEKYNSDVSDTRLVLLNGTGFAGSQRFGVMPSSGDVARSWSGLKSQPLVLLGASLSGIPYIHSDAGGFMQSKEADGELYTRWIQFATFTPIFKPHATVLEEKDVPSEPCFQQEPYKSIVRDYINLRYRLLPYNYSLSYEQTVLGKPLMRPLYYYSFADSNALRAEEEYMWGDAILVAPITTAGATARMVYLPAGKWYSLHDNTLTEGGRVVNQSADIKQIPVFVKEGSFLPMWVTKDTIKSVEGYNSKEINVRYYPSATPGSYVWYDDDGISTRTLEKADYELVTFKGVANGKMITIDITTNNPNQYGKRFKRVFTFEFPIGGVAQAKVNGKEVQLANGLVPVEFNGKALKLEVTTK